jgi:hypothetical protein
MDRFTCTGDVEVASGFITPDVENSHKGSSREEVVSKLNQVIADVASLTVTDRALHQSASDPNSYLADGGRFMVTFTEIAPEQWVPVQAQSCGGIPITVIQ